MLAESVDEYRLSRVEFDPAEIGVHPGDPVDLWKLTGTHLEGPRFESSGIEIGLHRPGPDDLS